MQPPIFAARLSVHRLRRLISSRLMFWFVLLLLPVAVLTVLAGATGAKKPESPTTIVERNLTVAPALQPPAPPSTTFTVNNLGDTGDAAPGNGACADGGGQCTLRAAIQEANSLAGTDTIEFSVTGTIQLGSVLPDLSTDITINGPGANLLTVRRNTGGDYRIFTISGGVTVAISGLTIANGKLGGGIYNEGGGIYNDGGTLTITNSTLSGNSVSGFDVATNYGGGIYNEGGTVTITNSTLSGNSASGFDATTNYGGGIYNEGGTVTITNSTLSGNSVSGFDAATNYGGGIYNEGGTVTITNSTLSGNSASFGGGIFNDGGTISSSGGTVNVRSAIIAQNTAAVGPDVSGTPTSQGHNLIGDNSGATVTPTTGDQIGTSASPIDAKLGPLASNGGPTQTHALLPGSPAIDAGDDCVLSNTCSPALGFSLTTDQRGFARQAGAHVDIGAVEVNYSISTTAGTPQSAVINSAFATLLQATITESGNVPSRIPVTFTPPASGPSGTFSGLATVNTDGSGVATAPTFTANGTAGGPYNVVASLGAGLPSTNFALTNLKANQTITFGALANKTFGDPDFDVTATATSGLPVSFSASGSCMFTSLPAGKVHLTGGGSCTITASQAGDANFNVAPDVPQLFTIAKANQTITFGALGNKTFGDPDFDVTATATSGLPVSFSASGPCRVTSLSPGKVHLTGGGSCTITASQAGDANFKVAPDVPQLFTIAKANQTITFGALANKTFGDPDFDVTATATSGLPVSFSASGPCTVTSLSSGRVHLTGGGSCTITASQAGDANFNVAPDVPQLFTIAKANQTITFGALGNKTFGDPDFDVTATATSGLPVSFSASGPCTVTSLSSGKVHLTGGGSCTITASQAGDANFNVAPDVPQLFTIAQAATTIAVASSVNPSNFGQSVTFMATVTSPAGTPTGTVQFKDGGTNLDSPKTLNGSGVATFSTTSLVAGVHTITADYQGDGSFLNSSGTLAGGQQVGSIIKFSSASYNTTEGSGFTIITVQRIGDLSQAVTVDYATPDDSSAMMVLPCATANGVASPRCDFTTALVTLRFAAGDGADKTFTVLINQDSFVEGPETLTLTLSNLTGDAGFTTPGATSLTATLTIADDLTEPATNPLDDTETFVRQQYHDFLNREPDPSGLAFWKDNIDKCNDPARRPPGLTVPQCIELFRINTSAAFFLSIEFQGSGYYVERLYKVAFGDLSPPTVPVPVRFTNFLRDTQEVGAGVIVGKGNWQPQLDNNKSAFALLFVQRPAFLFRYPALTSATAFVDSLNANAGGVLSDSERSALIAELSPNGADPVLRAGVLRKIAEHATLQEREFSRAFVLMQYVGYLRRNPDAEPEPNLNFDGYNFWLNKLNQFNGDFNQAEMVRAFINSIEYRQRFGP